MFTDAGIQRLLNTLALSVSLGIMLILPAGYGMIRYSDMVSDLEFKARLSAGRVARYVAINPELWHQQSVQLAEIIEIASVDSNHFRQSILHPEGQTIMKEDVSLDGPLVERRAPVVVQGQSVGTLRIEASVLRLWWETGIVALLAMILAGLSYGAFHLWPLTAVRSTMALLHKERDKVLATLEDLRRSERKLMAQGAELADSQRVARLGSWSMRPDGSEFLLSPEAIEVLGFTEETAPRSLLALAAQVVDASADSFTLLIRSVLKTRETCGFDFRFRRPDNAVIDLHIRMRPGEQDANWVYRIAGTVQDVSASKDTERQLETLAYFDPLTGLANRAFFKREMFNEVERLKMEGGTSTLLLMDLDRFKEVNDSLGHAAGDELLKRVAQSLGRLLPQSAFVARLGGDEFAIILRGSSTREEIAAVAQGIVDLMEKPFAIGRSESKIGASIGIVELIKDAPDVESLMKYADLALYRAKDEGRGCYRFFSADMDEVIQHKVMLARDLRQAARENRGLEVWFQPLVALEGRKVRGFEALMRWKHPTLGYIPPAEFIPLAESSSLISDLGSWILRETASTAKSWIDAGGAPYEVSVNLSPAQISYSEIEAEVELILRETGLPPHLLCLELTESLFVDHSQARVRQALGALKALGVSLALDDFGTGYSSLSYLTQLPFDKLKVDRAFVRDAPGSPKGQRVLEGIIALGHGLGMEVVAEGIERPEELAILEAAGCNLIQGYLIARPKPAAEALMDAAGLVETLRAIPGQNLAPRKARLRRPAA